MAPKTPKGAKRTEKETLENEATAKVAKEQPEQTPGASAVVADTNQLPKEVDKTAPQESEPVKGTTAANQASPAPAPVKGTQGDPVGEAAAQTQANGTAAEEKPQKEATAAGIEAGKTQVVEEPKVDEPTKDDSAKKAEPAIGEAKTVGETE